MRKHHDRQKHRGHSDVLEGWRQGGWQAQSLWMKDPGQGKSVCELGQGAEDTGANETEDGVDPGAVRPVEVPWFLT